jgi:hypothetical protein
VKLKTVSLAMLVFLSLVLGRAGSAQEIQPLEPEWLRQMYAEGWQKVQEGVLQRDTGGGNFETFGYGAEGLLWVVQGYEKQLSFLEGRYSEWPTAVLAEAIAQMEGEIDRLNAEISATPSAESFDGEALTACTVFDDSKQASAGPLATTQGVNAEASASFSSDCFIGDTFAVAYAEATDAAGVHTIITQEDPKNGASINSHATASVAGVANCYSWAQASVSYEGSTYLTPLIENYSCPSITPPVEASISGPTSVTTDHYISAGCANVTWTASATGGQPGGYTYKWYIGTTEQGTGSTLTKNYCNTTQSVTVKVVVSDSAGNTDEATFPTSISSIGAITTRITGPTSVSSSSSCVTVNWTVSATSNGHSGFTYKWYIGTTFKTNGTTYSKQFCRIDGTSQSVTVKATATASDGHQDTDTHSTSITFTTPPPPLTASISGPASVQLTTSTECKSITWTASATGGTPGYTYSWYIGTSTAVQGTAAMLTKSFCGAQTINVKVVVRDSAAQTDDATFTTTIKPPAFAASISGQDYVEIFGTYCADLIWTANVSGGTSPYSYSWTIGTSTTVLSTTSTLTKRVCNSQTLDVKLAVRDSASQTANATFTTIVYDEGSCLDSLCQ